MPTIQVTPATQDLLQDVANALGKARKVVVVTGAGISTNSGIPDFRSENGLYSLIQAQFERANAGPSPVEAVETTEEATEEATEESPGFDISDRPTKRRRVSEPHIPAIENAAAKVDGAPCSSHVKSEPKYSAEQHSADNASPNIDGPDGPSKQEAKQDVKQDAEVSSSQPQFPAVRPPFPRHLTQCSVRSSTSQDSIFSGPQSSVTSTQTSQTEDTPKSLPERSTASSTPRRTLLLGETVVSSPLSSPPPILFDPYENNPHPTQESSGPSSECSDSSDTEDTQRSLDLLSSQTAKPSLRNMKGRDLFDSNIWADPLKTSVFYRFATSLRQKVKEVEPTTTHHFIAQLRDLGKLARVYTQNIDEIEKKIGLSTDLRNGAGNKRRKSARQQPLAGPDRDVNDIPDQLKNEEETGSSTAKNDPSQPSTQASEEAERPKPRQGLSPDKGVECVFLHGSLHSLRCFVCGKLCDWDEDNRESRTLSGEQPECPHCAGATAARQEKGKRALGVGKLRPDIVLYGEEHPQSDLISPIVQHDLSAGPDLLLVLGTSLRVHGLKVMVKEFSKAVHNKGGKVIFINFTKPSESVWGDIIDYWIQWDCDAWVTDLKDRKPHLWLTPEEIQELEKQKRETLAEKRRENILKRESTSDRRHETEASKSRVPPKNPSAMRNDYGCGAYVVYDIFQSLAKIGDRPFDNLGYDPPQPTAIKEEAKPVTAKVKKPRKSAPAILSSRVDSPSGEQAAIRTRYFFSSARKIKGKGVRVIEHGAEPKRSVNQLATETTTPTNRTRGRPKKAAASTRAEPSKAAKRTSAEKKQPATHPGLEKRRLISETPIPPPKIPLLRPLVQQHSQLKSQQPQLQQATQPQPPAQNQASVQPPAPVQPQVHAQVQPQDQSQLLPAPEGQGSTTPSQDSSTSISAAVKSNPRRRKRKEIFEGVSNVKPAPPKPRRASRPASMPPPPAPSTDPPRIEQNFGDGNILSQEVITLAPIRPGLEVSTPAIKCLEPIPVVSPPSPLVYSTPTIPRPYPCHPYPSHPMLHSDPLVHLRYGTNFMRDTRGPRIAERRPAQPTKESTPSPSDQLQREHWEAAASLMTLGIAP